ncbi:MAG TPA: cytochrome c biogenesis CcdA family protein [Caulobacteraceae bacterium]
MGAGLNPLLAYAAGALTILSPCVLPLVPIVLGSVAQRHRLGPLALSLGLVISFAGVGLLIASLGASVRLDGGTVRIVGAMLMLLVGVALIVPAFQRWAERLTAPLMGWAGARQAGLERFGLWGQAAIGALLGLVWSPCVGPTLGAATVLAAQGRNLGQVALVMVAFGAGIGSVLMLLAFATRGFLSRWRGRLLQAGHGGKQWLGAMIAVVGLLILTGGDRTLEAAVLAVTPDWLTNFTASI